MPDLSQVTSKFVYKQRMDSAKQVISDFKQMGAVPTVIALATRFGATNRAFLHNWGIGSR